MARPKESRKRPRIAVPNGEAVGHRVVIIRDGKFVRPPRRKGVPRGDTPDDPR
jgi:hypothetical protein